MALAIQPSVKTIVIFVEENEKVPILAIQLNFNGLFMLVTGMEFEQKQFIRYQTFRYKKLND